MPNGLFKRAWYPISSSLFNTFGTFFGWFVSLNLCPEIGIPDTKYRPVSIFDSSTLLNCLCKSTYFCIYFLEDSFTFSTNMHFKT